VTPERTEYCQSCGAELTPGTRFCEACGAEVTESTASIWVEAPVQQPSPAQDAPFELPDYSYEPRLGRAVSIAWNLLGGDIFNALLASVLFVVILVLLAGLPALMLFVASFVGLGLLAWANARQTGMQASPGLVVSVPAEKFGPTLLLAILLFLFRMLLMIPVIIATAALIDSVMGISLGKAGYEDFWPIVQVLTTNIGYIIFASVWVTIIGIILAPLVLSFQMIASWAIVMGVPFDKAVAWAWKRLSGRWLTWWFNGFIIGLIMLSGLLFCGVGMIATLPLGFLTWQILISERG